MRRVAAVIAVVFALHEGVAHAQIAAALGRPLRDRSAKPGSVTVRVINGDPTDPIVGMNVTITVEGATRVVRTDAEGRARFFDLPKGKQAKVTVKAGENVADSQPFVIPAEGGVRLLMSPVPWKGAKGPAMGGGARGAPPNPKQMAGRIRGDASVPTRALRVRVLQGSFQNNAVGAVVHAVGYHADERVSKITKTTGKDGRVLFENLDNSGRVAYYVTAVITRGDVTDRLMSFPVMMPARGGAAMALVGESPDAKGQVADDLARYYQQPKNPLEGGDVLVEIGSAMSNLGEVSLVEIGRTNAVARAPVAEIPPRASQVQGALGKALPDDQLPAGSLMIEVMRQGKGTPPIAGATVELKKAGATTAPKPAPAPGPAKPEATDDSVKLSKTGGTGLVRHDKLEIGATYQVKVIVHGREMSSAPFVIGKDKGVRIRALANWPPVNTLAARFTGLTSSPGSVYMAQTKFRGQLYRSAPFQLMSHRGTFARILVVPKLMFRFHLGGRLDDKYMVFQGQFALNNVSYAPWVPKDGELLLPLPDGFAGAQVADEDEDNVKIIEKKGFLWKGFAGAVPPGGLDFRAAFTVPLERGTVDFDMPLPWGVFNSNLTFDYADGMKVKVPGRARGQVRQLEDGRKFYVMRGITILPKQRMVMQISGLPQTEAWRRYVDYAVGVGVLILLTLGVVGVAMARRREQNDERLQLTKQRERLLEELVALERKREEGKVADKKYEKTKANLVKQLERIYAQLDGQPQTA